MPAGLSSDYAAATAYLYAMKAVHGVTFGVDRMRLLAEALGHPERAVPLVHVAGTNGKGSVVAMLDAILHAAGWRTGMYTSPHLVRLGERVQVDRRLLTPEEITAYVRELQPVAERLGWGRPENHPSFFEFMTAMALLQFVRTRCDIGLVEVGLGGRLDATNIITPELSVITSIGLDHCEILGDTLAAIAGEKAGIIKPGVPVVMGRMPPEAEAVIRAVAVRAGARVHAVREVFGEDAERYPVTNLGGAGQRWNAATATLAARVLGARWRLNDEVIVAGLQRVSWPGRWERVTLADGRTLILDASHNPEGAQVLDENLRKLEMETHRQPVIITGVLGLARARALMPVIARHAREIHLVVPDQSRACSQAELAALIPAGFAGRVRDATVAELFPEPGRCAAGDPEDVLVVTGSIYLTGEVMARLEPGVAAESRLQDF